ncbi:hypothetical protein PGT21_016305 [Puccinia graminis f. sp. tritici]|uniref:Uncharacterized protein n=1 Tax=Puccinia graminis f. sp. tritici TaxID=56615 RepID=A0A5B0P615_PUCGR|nr:hypothetical protein PGT21_016305 [Puccinia graminis f. sp. tritici]
MSDRLMDNCYPPLDAVESPRIIDLRGGGCDSSNGLTEPSLRQEIIDGLTRQTLVVPGNAPEDRSFAYSKLIPTGEWIVKISG